MKTEILFSHLLNISLPFEVSKVIYKDEPSETLPKKSVHIYISVERSAEYRPLDSSIHDYEDRTWRHLNLFQYPCYIHCSVPKYKDKVSNKVKTLSVPWAKPGLGFTILFEEFALELIKIHGCVSEVAAQLSIYPQRLWRIVRDYAREISAVNLDFSQVRRIGFDETSKKKGHEYITCFIDLDTGELLYVVEGKSSDVVTEFTNYAVSQGLDKEKVSDISIDMSPAFISGSEKEFVNAEITFDKFHVSQLVQKAFDNIRKSVGRKEGGRINKWLFFTPYDELKTEEQEQLDRILVKYPIFDMVYELKNNFKILWEQTDRMEASAFLSFWAGTMRSFKKKVLTTLAKTLDKHHHRIINVIDTKITNAVLEGFNSKIQILKRKARGYKNAENLMLMVKLHCAK
jgi:transposase